MENTAFQSGYSEVNGLRMYYEIYGTGSPLVLIHGGGSTIQTTFGRLIPLLAHGRQIIAVELQAHGHTSDRDADLSFEQDADDVAGLLKNIGITKADFLGFSNGGQTAIEIALRYPQIVNRLILASTFYNRNAAAPQFWEGFSTATLDMMPILLQQGYLNANNSPEGLLTMFNKDVQRMKDFKDWSDEQIRSIKAPTLVISSSMDVGSPEHAVKMYRTIPNCELAIFPGLHGAYLGAIEVLEDANMPSFNASKLIEAFLDRKDN
jgi:pimeloyl-ACP methyl ester carboxylesterase